ncbi:MAG: TonB-dependent receptor [Pseudomonadota bacterium]
MQSWSQSSNAFIVVFSILFSSLAHAAASEKTDEVAVVAILEDLRAAGLEVNYSSDLVPAELKVPLVSGDRDRFSRARDALATHGLSLVRVSLGRYVVTMQQQEGAAQSTSEFEEPLEEVSVYGSRYNLEGRVIAGPQVLASTDIQMVPGSHDDPLRALHTLPGIVTNASGRPYIRGSLSDDVLIQFDGVPLADPFHLKNFQSLISAIDPAAVERIELFSGGFPVRYGTRSGGVINIVPTDRESGFENSVGASLLAMSASTVGRSERMPLEWLVTARRSALDLLEPVESGFGSPQFADSIGRFRWTASESLIWSAGWLLLEDKIRLGDPADEEFAIASYRDGYSWLSLEFNPDERLSSRTTAVATSTKRVRSGISVRPGVSAGEVSEARSARSLEVLTDWVYTPYGDTEWNVGAALTSTGSNVDYRRRLEIEPDVAVSFNSLATGDLDYVIDTDSSAGVLYTSVRKHWSRLEAEAGIRLDWQHYRMQEVSSQLSPRLNARYDITDRVRAYASLGRFTQAQRVDEWRSEEAQRSPDPSQKAVHAIVGVEVLRGKSTRFGVEIYTKRWTTVSPYFDSRLDPASLLPDLSPDRIRLTPTRSEAAGLELSVRTTVSPGLAGWGTLTWSRVADAFGRTDTSRSWDQPLSLGAGVVWKGSRDSLSALASWHTGWPKTPIRVPAQADPAFAPIVVGGRNAGRWDDFYSIDLRASRLWLLGGGELTGFVEVTNAMNKSNDCCVSLERLGSAGPYVSEVDHWLPLIANLGFTFSLRSEK